MAWSAIGRTSPIGGVPSPPAFLSKGVCAIQKVRGFITVLSGVGGYTRNMPW